MSDKIYPKKEYFLWKYLFCPFYEKSNKAYEENLPFTIISTLKIDELNFFDLFKEDRSCIFSSVTLSIKPLKAYRYDCLKPIHLLFRSMMPFIWLPSYPHDHQSQCMDEIFGEQLEQQFFVHFSLYILLSLECFSIK